MTEPSLINALVLVGGKHHDQPGAREALREALTSRGGVRLTITEDLSMLANPSMTEYDVLVNYTTGATLTPEEERGLLDFVSGGKGFAGIHCATVTFRESAAYDEMIGSRFIKHPPFGPVNVSITDADHPITHGIGAFSVLDELYVLDCDPRHVHLLARVSAGEVDQPCTYTKQYGQGRVFYTSLGHDPRCFISEDFRTIVHRGLRWATRSL